MRTWTWRLGLVALVACSPSASDRTGDGNTPDDPNAPPNDPTTTPTPPTAPPPDPVDSNPDEPWSPPVETGAVTFPYTAYRCGYATRQVSPSKPTATFHEDAGAAAPKNLHLTIAGNASSSVVFEWSTDDATKATQVRFGDSPTGLDKTASGYSFTYGVNGRRQHEVHLCGLKPGRTYYYDAGGPKARSKIYKFTTAPDAATDVKILVLGDSRSDTAPLAAMQAHVLAQGPTAMVLTGDAVASGGSQSNWDALFASAPDLFAQIPGLWANGNHEDGDEVYYAQHALPDNGGTSGVEEWYATTYGPIRFIVLNDTPSSSGDIAGAEKAFLEGTLKAVDKTRTPFMIALHHKPMWTTSSGHSSETALRAPWGTLFEQYHLQIDLAGHVHSYETTKPLKAGAVVPDAQGTRYFVFGGAGAPLYGFSAMQPWIQTRESVHGFAIMSASATETKWSSFRQDGSAIETITVPK